MKHRMGRIIIFSQLFILLAFLLLTLGNEILDLPHFLLGDQPTSIGQRSGEVLLEIFFFVAIIGIEFIKFSHTICPDCRKKLYPGK